MSEERFPVGGPRQPVHDFMRSHGFTMSNFSDKFWTRGPFTVRIYGAGSMATISDETHKVVVDAPLESAIEHIVHFC